MKGSNKLNFALNLALELREIFRSTGQVKAPGAFFLILKTAACLHTVAFLIAILFSARFPSSFGMPSWNSDRFWNPQNWNGFLPRSHKGHLNSPDTNQVEEEADDEQEEVEQRQPGWLALSNGQRLRKRPRRRAASPRRRRLLTKLLTKLADSNFGQEAHCCQLPWIQSRRLMVFG